MSRFNGSVVIAVLFEGFGLIGGISREAPAIPAKAVVAGRRDRRSILSFFFDDAVGLWLPKK